MDPATLFFNRKCCKFLLETRFESKYTMKPTAIFILILTCALLNLLLTVECHLILVEPHQEDCFHEKLQKGTKIKFTFEVLDGGSLDIDLTIKDPTNYIIHSEQRQSSGRYTIEANQDGQHTYCFSNKMSTVATKIVMFNVELNEVKKESDHEQDRLQNMVTELSGLVTGVKHEMDFLAARDTIHRRINEVTNGRVTMWSFIEVCLTLIVAVGQTYFIKQFFEVRRRV